MSNEKFREGIEPMRAGIVLIEKAMATNRKDRNSNGKEINREE